MWDLLTTSQDGTVWKNLAAMEQNVKSSQQQNKRGVGTATGAKSVACIQLMVSVRHK